MEDDGESLEETGENVKNFFVYNLNFESVPEIEHAHNSLAVQEDRMEPQSQERLCANSSATKRRIPFLRQQGE